MSSIFEEYRRRHNIKTILPITEGLLFLEREGEPAGIVLTSSFTKSLTICRDCSTRNSEVTAELFLISSFPATYSVVCHDHISADMDVALFVERNAPHKVVPYISKGERDQERWLWDFFIASCKGKRSGANAILTDMYGRSGRCDDPSMIWIDDQFWMATNAYEMFSQYYENVYSYFAINRKYLLSV